MNKDKKLLQVLDQRVTQYEFGFLDIDDHLASLWHARLASTSLVRSIECSKGLHHYTTYAFPINRNTDTTRILVECARCGFEDVAYSATAASWAKPRLSFSCKLTK